MNTWDGDTWKIASEDQARRCSKAMAESGVADSNVEARERTGLPKCVVGVSWISGMICQRLAQENTRLSLCALSAYPLPGTVKRAVVLPTWSSRQSSVELVVRSTSFYEFVRRSFLSHHAVTSRRGARSVLTKGVIANQLPIFYVFFQAYEHCDTSDELEQAVFA